MNVDAEKLEKEFEHRLIEWTVEEGTPDTDITMAIFREAIEEVSK